jgi:hypothetical protein
MADKEISLTPCLHKPKNNQSRMACILIGVAILGCCIFLIYFTILAFAPIDYETSNLSDYHNFVGVGEKWQEECLDSFLPEVLLPEYENVQYIFHSRTVDACGFEAYLEFTFSDEKAFEEHLQQYTEGKIPRTFYFDNAYQEYAVYHEQLGKTIDHLSLSDSSFQDENGRMHYYINSAKIMKLLVEPNEKRVIYVAIAVIDGGGTDTQLLDAFFTRFQIDPKEYESYARDN